MKSECSAKCVFFTVLTVPAFALLYLNTILSVVIVLILVHLGLRKPARFVIKIWAYASFFLIGRRVTIQGKNRMTLGQRYILLANHSSLFDIMAIMAFYPGISWFGKEYLVKIPVFGYLLRILNYVPMKAADLRNTKQMIQHITEKSTGNTVGIFPEGTRTTTGKLGVFRKGFLQVLKATELPVLPVTLNGFFKLKPKNRFYIDFASRLQVCIHEPIHASDLLDYGDNELVAHLKGIVESSLNESVI